MTTELFLRLLVQAKEEKVSDRKRYCRLGDLAQIHMALGAEEVCELIERRLRAHLEMVERNRCEQEQKFHARRSRSQQRQLIKLPQERIA